MPDHNRTTGLASAKGIQDNLPGLLPLIPVLYIAWNDCVLTPTEISTIRNLIDEQTWLTQEERSAVLAWLDPASPPGPDVLLNWLKIIRDAADDLSESSKMSLVQLGQEISKIGAENSSERCSSPEACSALAIIEQLLGVVSPEATQKILADASLVKHTVAAKGGDAGFPIALMQRLLDCEDVQIREKTRTLLADPAFRHRAELTKHEYREQVLSWCRLLAEQGLGALSYPEAQGGKNDLRQFIAAFETIAYHDLSLTIKFGVQFGLFGGSILNLGTDVHHKTYLAKVGSLELPGCFAMTELGHGSNVKDIETTATFDAATGEFVIHTPTESARKDYIGNAALHGQMATVFAQLVIGDACYGVHAFLTPLRDTDGSLMPGVRIEDCGLKMGLNGVDNGRIWFEQVRIPRENLLNRFADVGADGSYSSPIASASKRFFTMLGTLVGGRISIAAASVSAAKSALTIAVRYAGERRQFGPAGEHETLLLDYPSHQRRLLPLLAKTYALDFAQKRLVTLFAQAAGAGRETEVLAAGLKSLASWHATETIQVCRESCGGKGYLAENRFSDLKADSDVFTTFEGDNTVLLQLVAKGLLTEFKHHFNEMNTLGILKYAAMHAATKIVELNPVVTRLTDEGHLRDAGFHHSAFIYREQRLLVSAARRIKNRLDAGSDALQAFTACQNHLITLATAHIERVVLEAFQQTVKNVEDTNLRSVLTKLCTLFALSTLERDKGWFLESGYVEGAKSKAIRHQVEQLCLELRSDAVALVDSFGIPDTLLAAPIAVSRAGN